MVASSKQADGFQVGAIPFLRVLDALPQALAFCTCTGEMLHANRTLRHALECGPEATWLRVEMGHLARSTYAQVHRQRLGEGAEKVIEGIHVHEIPGEAETLRLVGSYVGLDLFGRGPSILVALERAPVDPLSAAGLRTRFALTTKEILIARLLARGRSNPEIAREMSISLHTVRRHVEKVLRKLGVRSRAGVALAVLGSEGMREQVEGQIQRENRVEK